MTPTVVESGEKQVTIVKVAEPYRTHDVIKAFLNAHVLDVQGTHCRYKILPGQDICERRGALQISKTADT